MDRRARDGRARRRGRRRQDGPAAGRPVRVARLAGDRGRRPRRRSSTAINEGRVARRRGARASPSSSRTPTPPAACGRRPTAPAAARDSRRRRPHRAGDARRRAAARLPLHGRRGRRDRAGRPRRARSSSSRRRCPSATRAAGSRRGSRRRPGSTPSEDLFVAFSPERLYSGAALRNLATYPKLVGGIGPASTARAAAFYDAVLDAEVVAMSSRRGGRVQQARRHDVPRRQHRPRQRVRRATPSGSASTSTR